MNSNMVKAWQIISKCISSNELGNMNEFYRWIDGLDGVDSWYSYISSPETLNSISSISLDALYKDSLWRKNPSIETNILDIDDNSIYIARNPDWTIQVNDKWQAIYKYHSTWEEVDWSQIQNKKEEVFKFLFFKYERDAKKMALAPIWYKDVKTSMLLYVDYLRKHFPRIMTDKWFQMLKMNTEYFFNNIESWNWNKKWYNVIYNLFDSEMWNHWYFIQQMIWDDKFSKMLSDRSYAEEYLWYKFVDVSFREFSEAAAAYAGKATWWHVTVVDVLWSKYADIIYGKDWLILYEEKDWKMVRVPIEDAKRWNLNKSYFMKLSVSQQIDQIKSTLSNNAPSFWAFWMWVRFKIWTYNLWASLLRILSFVWNPSLYSTFMMVANGWAWALPLLILNSTMFFTDRLARWPKLDWNWWEFMNRHWLQWWAAIARSKDTSIWQTVWDYLVRSYKRTKWQLEAWLYNVWDSFTQESYRIRQLQNFFMAYFPWVKTLEELEEQIDLLKATNFYTYSRLIEAANWYSEFSVRKMTTNSWVAASTTNVHVAKDIFYQPWVDTRYSLRHFFAWWWLNKVKWWWDVIKTWIWNIYRWDIGASYIDKLLNTHSDPFEVQARLVRNFLQNEDLVYTLNKFYYSLIIAKYIDRLSWWTQDDDTLFESFDELRTYMELFSWEVAALESIPMYHIWSTMLATFMEELDNWESLSEAWWESMLATAKEFLRISTRRLYMWKILTQYTSELNRDWDQKEKEWLPKLWKVIWDNTTWFLYFLKDQASNWEYDYYTPRWPQSYVNSILWVQDDVMKFISEEVNAGKYYKALHSWDWFTNWLLYSAPFTKQWMMWQMPEITTFMDDMNKFRATKWYQQMTNNEIPEDFNDSDWSYAYNTIVWRLINDNKKIWDDLKWEYSFETEDWTIQYNKARQSQEDLLHLLMSNWLSKEKAIEFNDAMSKWLDWRKEEALRTLAYIEAKTPWSSLQALAYLMNRAWFEYAYINTPKELQWNKDVLKKAEIYAAQKYAEYIPEVDRALSWTQIVLHYAKVHDTALAPYISWPGENNKKQMKLITPWDEERYMKAVAAWKEWEYIYKNTQLAQNFQAQLMVDIEWAAWNPNARKLMNWYATIFNINKFVTNEDWSIDPEYAAYALNQLEQIYDHIDWLAMEDNSSKLILKQWTLMFWDKLFPSIINDKELMKREDVQTVVKDWVHYRYKDFRELDEIATQAAEEALCNKEWKSRWASKNFFKSWAKKQFSWFNYRYDYMKKRAYSDNYSKYRVFDWTPRSNPKDYLSESEFLAAKRRMANSRQWWPASTSSNSYKWKSNSDDWIWVSTRRWASLAFVKREDIDKPTEYKLPRRKRRVKKWSWVKPISTTTWKHLTPTPKKKW